MAMRFQKIVLAVAIGVSIISTASCGRKKLSERDEKREQMRATAESKRRELAPAKGLYRGFLQFPEESQSAPQDVTLDIQIKDVPDDAGGEIDPVLVPQLAGSLRLTYGHPDEGEYISFGVTRGDFDAKTKAMSLTMDHETFKVINLSLQQSGDQLSGVWAAETASASGTMLLQRADPLNLKASNKELRGDYSGALRWATEGIYQESTLSVATAQNRPDGFTIGATLKIFSGDRSVNEVQTYDFDQIELSPFSRQVTFKGSDSEVYVQGVFETDRFEGNWFSRKSGRIGPATFRKGNQTAVIADGEAQQQVQGTYYGKLVNRSGASNLPERFVLTIVPYHDSEHPGGLAYSGNIRFYLGSFNSTEYLEFPFKRLEYNHFTRNFDGQTEGTPKLTVDADIRQGVVRGRILDDAVGFLGSFEATRSRPEDTTTTVAGRYGGYAIWNSLNAWQRANLEVIPSFSPATGMVLQSTLRMSLGSSGQGGEETVTRFEPAAYNAINGNVVFSTSGSELMLRGTILNGLFSGEWFTRAAGRMGAVQLLLGGDATVPAGFTLISPIQGRYQGQLVNTNPQSGINLQERFLIGLVTASNPSAPNGIDVTGGVRFYVGAFGSNDYFEYSCETLAFDFYRRSFSCKLSGGLNLTVKGQLGSSAIIGTIDHDGSGQVATFDVARQ